MFTHMIRQRQKYLGSKLVSSGKQTQRVRRESPEKPSAKSTAVSESPRKRRTAAAAESSTPRRSSPRRQRQ